MKTAIVTDTNSGMSVEEGQKRGIYVIPMPVIIDGTTYLEGKDISYTEVFHAMEEKKPVSTSQPSPGDVMDVWRRAFADGYQEVVYIPMSSGLSSSYHTAKQMTEEISEGNVVVVDNHRISLTLYESVLDAKALADEGKTAEEIRIILEEETSDNTIYLTVNSVEHLKKSGRITAAGAALATLLMIRPVLTIQGERLDGFAKARGKRIAERIMLSATLQDLKEKFWNTPKKHILIGAAGTLINREEIERWSEIIKSHFPGYPFLYHPLSCSIACHTGPNAFGTGFVFMNRGWSGE